MPTVGNASSSAPRAGTVCRGPRCRHGGLAGHPRPSLVGCYHARDHRHVRRVHVRRAHRTAARGPGRRPVPRRPTGQQGRRRRAPSDHLRGLRPPRPGHRPRAYDQGSVAAGRRESDRHDMREAAVHPGWHSATPAGNSTSYRRPRNCSAACSRSLPPVPVGPPATPGSVPLWRGSSTSAAYLAVGVDLPGVPEHRCNSQRQRAVFAGGGPVVGGYRKIFWRSPWGHCY